MDRQAHFPQQRTGETDIAGQLANWRWLEALAKKLIGDVSLADDACQEAWLASSRRGEPDPDRGRLALDLRRFLWRSRRSERRRTRRESEAARNEALPSTQELLIRGEQQQHLWAHLTKLEEPFRSTLLLRFQEGFDTAEIAERQAAPQDSVRWRVRRGLELLRKSLERDHEAGGLAGIALLGSIRPSSASATAKAMGIQAKLKQFGGATKLTGTGALIVSKIFSANTAPVAIAALLTLVGITSWKLTAEREVNQVLELQTSTDVQPQLPAEPAFEVEIAQSIRQAIESTARNQTPSEAAAAEEPSARLTGRLIDEGGAGLVGISVEVKMGKGLLIQSKSDENGHFELFPPIQETPQVYCFIGRSPYLETKSFALGTTTSCSFGPLVDKQLAERDLGEITLAATGTISGRLVDKNNSGIAGARARTSGDDRSNSATTAADGSFRLAHVPPGYHELDLNARGYLEQPRKVEVHAQANAAVGEIVLVASPKVSGQIVDPNGQPLLNATISSNGFTKGWTFKADDQGRFEVLLPEKGAGRLYARAPGFLQNSEAVIAMPGSTDALVQLEASGQPCQIAVVDAITGEPLERFGLRVRRGKHKFHSEREDKAKSWDWSPTPERDWPEGIARFSAHPDMDWIFVNASGYKRNTQRIRLISISGAEAPSGANTVQQIAMTRAPGIIGRIVENGVGVAGVDVQLGSGELAFVEEIEPRERAKPEQAASQGNDKFTPMQVALKRQGGYVMLKARMVDSERDQPFPGLRLDDMRFSFWALSVKTTTDTEGRFHFVDVQDPIVQLHAFSKGKSARSELVAASKSQTTDLGDFELRALADVRGQIEVQGSGPLSGHRVRVLAGKLFEAETDEDGRFNLTGLPAGEHFLKFDAGSGLYEPGVQGHEHFFRLKAGETRKLTIQVDTVPACTLTATVMHNGKPMSLGHLSVLPANKADKAIGGKSKQLDENGQTTLTVAALIPMNLSIDLGDSEIQVGSTRNLPIGEHSVHLEAWTSELQVQLPENTKLPESPHLALRWRNSNGEQGPDLRTDFQDTELGAPSRALFPGVPVDATDLELILRKGRRYSSSEVVASWPLSVQLEGGKRAEILL